MRPRGTPRRRAIFSWTLLISGPCLNLFTSTTADALLSTPCTNLAQWSKNLIRVSFNECPNSMSVGETINISYEETFKTSSALNSVLPYRNRHCTLDFFLVFSSIKTIHCVKVQGYSTCDRPLIQKSSLECQRAVDTPVFGAGQDLEEPIAELLV